ncbi:MAG: sulfite exporter TauE/SafE family protein, partial [Clostridia bacterium]|nr:sulfite exporter TauE/SafE family protein [Clostridia bacterium]
TKYQFSVNIVTGLIVIIFGLNFLGILKLNIFKGMSGSAKTKDLGFFSSALFGIVFSIGWTPCVGAFLGSALMLASQQGKVLTGVIMLLAYSLGLGIPFVISAVLIDKLKSAFNFIKKNYKIINIISGSLLILLGVLMMTGLLGKFLSFLN